MEKMFTAADFDTEVLGSDKPVLVDFFATWCGPGVMNVPTLILFKDGRAVERKVGLQSASDLRKLLDSVL